MRRLVLSMILNGLTAAFLFIALRGDDALLGLGLLGGGAVLALTLRLYLPRLRWFDGLVLSSVWAIAIVGTLMALPVFIGIPITVLYVCLLLKVEGLAVRWYHGAVALIGWEVIGGGLLLVLLRLNVAADAPRLAPLERAGLNAVIGALLGLLIHLSFIGLRRWLHPAHSVESPADLGGKVSA